MAISDSTHPIYRDGISDWHTIRRMVTGEGVENELVRRYFEHEEHYDKRQEIADFTPWTRHLLNRLAGMLFQRADDVSRDIGPIQEGWGETAGSNGEDYNVLLLQLAFTLLGYNSAVVALNPRSGLCIHTPIAMRHMGDGARTLDANGDPLDEQMDGGEPFVTMQSSRVMSPSPEEDGKRETTYVVYTPRGYQEWAERDNKDEDVLVDSGVWAEGNPFFVLDGEPVPPVVRIEMPWEAQLGLLVAKKHRAIYRMTSRRDFSLSAAMNGLIQLGVGEDVEMQDVIEDDAKRGKKFLPYNSEMGEHKGLQLPTEGAKLGTSVLKSKKKDLAEIAYNQMEEGARTSTSATEAMIKERGAAAAALSVVAETMSDAEQKILTLVAQAQDFRRYAGPNPTEVDVGAEWPTDYSDVVGADKDSLAKAIFGSKLPADEETATEVLMDTFEEEGYSPDEASLQEEVRQALDRSSQATSNAGSFLG